MDINLCDFIRDAFGLTGVLSLLSAIIFGYIVQPKYIIKRYEVETELLRTFFFEHLEKVFGDKFKNRGRGIAVLYSIHLFVILIVGNKFFLEIKSLKDIKDRNDILKHFSKKEKIYTLITGISLVFSFVWGIGYALLDDLVCPH